MQWVGKPKPVMGKSFGFRLRTLFPVRRVVYDLLPTMVYGLCIKQEDQLSLRDRATLRVME